MPNLLGFFLIGFAYSASRIHVVAFRDEANFSRNNNERSLLDDTRSNLMNSYRDARRYVQGDNDPQKYGSSLGYSRYRNTPVRIEIGNKYSRRDSSEWHFSYGNIDEWGQHYPDCLGQRQSPVDIDSHAMAKLQVQTPFVPHGYRNIPKNMTIANNGHTIELSGFWEGNKRPYISGGALEGDYAFHQLHFHWSSKDDTGSEHTVNNRPFPLEMHMVHYKRNYGSASEAMKHKDGLAVIGFLFEVGKKQNQGISGLESYTTSIKRPGEAVRMRPLSLSKFDFPSLDGYVVYLGSLTTPPCSEIVTWFLPAIPRCMTRKQLDFFQSLELANRDDRNYRPTQSINGRMIYYVPE